MACHLYAHGTRPQSWMPQYHDSHFLSANSAALIRRLGNYYGELPLQKIRAKKGEERSLIVFTKTLFEKVEQIFQPKPKPAEFVAACVNIAFAAKDGANVREVSAVDVRKWMGLTRTKTNSSQKSKTKCVLGHDNLV